MSGGVTPERLFCDAAREYLLSFAPSGVTSEVLDHYLELSDHREHDICDVYLQLLWSAQNANMKASVIGKSMTGGVNALSDVLIGFEPAAVQGRYGDDSVAVLDDIIRVVSPSGQIRRKPLSIWPRYCRSVVSGAAFLSRFGGADEFYAWADTFDSDDKSRLELPSVISREVEGLGFALSCDFLKEIGYSSFGKPDVHIRRILSGLGLMKNSASDPEALSLLWSFSRAAGFSPYYVDKLMWLVGSGKFYHHGEIGIVSTDRDGFVGSQRYLFGSA